MSRQVDVKSLVSHIIRGDGTDKCRICLGDTSEGQVYLGDTVMLDGNKPVTLAELLETITGIEVEEEPGVPRGACRNCSEETIAAVQFRQLCADSHKAWHRAAEYLAAIAEPAERDKTYYIFYNENGETIIKDQVNKVKSTKEAYERLTETIITKKVKRQKKILRRAINCSCPDCGKRFTTAYSLNQHLTKTMRRACVFCGIITPRDQLNRHLSKMHNKTFFDCIFCFKLFTDEESLKQHQSKYHGLHSCSCCHCGEGFEGDRALRAHMYTHTLFHCDSCTQSFENRKCYKYHKRSCERTGPSNPNMYFCDDCGNSYDKKPSLRIHIVQKHLNVLPYVCSTCGKRTSTLAHLRSHQAVHTSDRTTLMCNICGAKMRTELGYALHQRIHTGEKPYKCAYCGDCFLSSSRRLDHIKRRHISAKEMPHACPECPSRFVRPFELRKHMASIHDQTEDYVIVPARRRTSKRSIPTE